MFCRSQELQAAEDGASIGGRQQLCRRAGPDADSQGSPVRQVWRQPHPGTALQQSGNFGPFCLFMPFWAAEGAQQIMQRAKSFGLVVLCVDLAPASGTRLRPLPYIHRHGLHQHCSYNIVTALKRWHLFRAERKCHTH